MVSPLRWLTSSQISHFREDNALTDGSMNCPRVEANAFHGGHRKRRNVAVVQVDGVFQLIPDGFKVLPGSLTRFQPST